MTASAIQNTLASVERQLAESQQKLENLQGQLAAAKEEVQKPFAHEAELAEKSARLAELNAMLNMDEHSPGETLGVDEETDQSVRENAAKSHTEALAGRSAELLSGGQTFADLASDISDSKAVKAVDISGKSKGESQQGKDSLLDRLQAKKAELSAGIKRTDMKMHAEPAL